MNWFERLVFYTRDFTKEEKIELVSYIAWTKSKFITKEAEEIKELIKKDDKALNFKSD